MEIWDSTERDEFFDRFYEKEFPKMRKYALTIIGNRAITEEIIQDAFMEALLNLDYLMTCDKPERWLRKTVKNKALHILRDRARDMRRLVYLDAQDTIDIPGPDELEKVEEEASQNISELKQKILKAIPKEDLQLFVRYLRKGMTYKMLAAETGHSISACQKRIQRTRNRLARIFSENF